MALSQYPSTDPNCCLVAVKVSKAARAGVALPDLSSSFITGRGRPLILPSFLSIWYTDLKPSKRQHSTHKTRPAMPLIRHVRDQREYDDLPPATAHCVAFEPRAAQLAPLAHACSCVCGPIFRGILFIVLVELKDRRCFKWAPSPRRRLPCATVTPRSCQLPVTASCCQSLSGDADDCSTGTVALTADGLDGLTHP